MGRQESVADGAHARAGNLEPSLLCYIYKSIYCYLTITDPPGVLTER
jgi:hypothetical protein